MYFLHIDINECLQPGVCGPNAVCRNVPGNFTCDCKDGYRGNPITGVRMHNLYRIYSE